MFKLLLIGIVTYIVYSIYLRYIKQDNIKKTNKSSSPKKYSKMNISDAEFTDIDDE
jgi:hypothetical protein